MKFELDRLPEYSDEALIAEIKRVGSIVGDDNLSITEFGKHSRVGVSTLRRRFGSWPKALEAAGLGDRYNKPSEKTRSSTASRAMTSEEILEEIRSVSNKIGSNTITAEDISSHASVGLGAIRGRFGSLKAAIAAAGLTQTALGRRYSDEECFENLLKVWTHYGRPPMHREMGSAPSEVGAKAYVKRWGTWNKALHAFVERVNLDTSPVPEANIKTTAPRRPQTAERDSREIRLGLRYAVLKRDHFRCVICGASPALTPGVRLHIDHIFPFSKGGKTELENLRTLCEACNLGKGAKVE